MPAFTSVLAGIAAGTGLAKGIASLASSDKNEQPVNQLTSDQTGVAQTLNREFTAPGGAGYRPVGQGLGGLGQNNLGAGYAGRLAAIGQQLQGQSQMPLPGSTNQLPTGRGPV